MATILVVDDDPVVQRTIAYVMEAEGHKAVRASNGLEALKRLQQQPFDLIISDVKMPGLDGLGLLKKVREHEQHSTLPMILITARLDAYEALPREQLGQATFLTKPLSSEDLAGAVTDLLQKAER